MRRICRNCGRAFISGAYDFAITGGDRPIVATRPDQSECIVCYLLSNRALVRKEAKAFAEQGMELLVRVPRPQLFAPFLPLEEAFGEFARAEEQWSKIIDY